MKVIVDRIEENIASVELENGKIINLPKILLEEACEGDIVEIKVLKSETKKKRESLKELVDKLFED